MMGSFSIWHLIVFVALAALMLIPARVLSRMGYPGWACLLLLVPVVNIAAIWWLALKPWPKESSALMGEVITSTEQVPHDVGQPSSILTNVKGIAAVLTGGGAVIGLILFAILQMYAGYLGIQFHFGTGWAWTAVILTLIFRFTLPLTIGAFFGAMNVWGWHWALAGLFAAPGLLFVVPGVIAMIVAGVASIAKR